MERNNRRKILIISPNFKEPTAWMISAYKTALGLSKIEDLQVIVLTSRTKGSKAYERMGKVKVYRSECFYIPDPFNSVITYKLFKDLRRIDEKEKPDYYLISKYMFFTSLAAFWLRKKKKKYVLQTDTFPGYCWFTKSTIVNLAMWIYTRTIGLRILRKASKVWLLHEGLIAHAERLKLKWSVIHNGVDLKMLRKAKPAKDLVKYKKNKLLVTFLGRLDKVKGYELLLETAEKARKDPELKDKIKFLYVCSDKYPEKRKALKKKYPHIKFEGFRPDVDAVWNATDIHILGSYSEGLPNSVMEAMAAGCAVISTKVGGVPYLIKNGENGLLAKTISSESLYKELRRIVLNGSLRRKIQEKAPLTIEKNYNWNKIPKEMIKSLEETYVRH